MQKYLVRSRDLHAWDLRKRSLESDFEFGRSRVHVNGRVESVVTELSQIYVHVQGLGAGNVVQRSLGLNLAPLADGGLNLRKQI